MHQSRGIGWTLLNDVRHLESLSGAGDTEQGLALVAFFKAFY